MVVLENFIFAQPINKFHAFMAEHCEKYVKMLSLQPLTPTHKCRFLMVVYTVKLA
jgi:hypothetical protein